MTSKEMVKIAYEALSDKRDRISKSSISSRYLSLRDYFIIADGSNVNQVQAMADNVEEMLAKAGCECRQIEGYQSGNWILMDYKDVIVHIFCRGSFILRSGTYLERRKDICRCK